LTFSAVSPKAARAIIILANWLIAETARFSTAHNHFLWFGYAHPNGYQNGTIAHLVIPTGIGSITAVQSIQFQ